MSDFEGFVQRYSAAWASRKPGVMAALWHHDGELHHPALSAPIPGDRVIGFLSAGKGIVVHRELCRNVKEFRKVPDRLIDVAWDPEEVGLFSVGLRVDVHNRPGGLATVATAISEADTNIENVINRERDGETSRLIFTVAVRGRRHLARIMRRVRRSPVVISVHRDAG